MQAIGLMSGTSLDGLDVCCATFRKDNLGKWSYRIDAVADYQYDTDMKYKLGKGAQEMSALEFVTFHSQYGFFLGKCVKDFLTKHPQLHPDIIASHGHTIFHVPNQKVMYQIGDGAAIRAVTGIPVVSDFRRLDIMMGGQGAPLVPIGDRLLFSDYDFCLNIGGFSNISFEQDGKRIAFDISPANYVVNYYCRQIELDFDRDGLLASQGKVDELVLQRLNALNYYHQVPPKSLGREWVEENVYPLLDTSGLSREDKLRTFYEHAAMQIAAVVQSVDRGTQVLKMLVTGGGAYNKFLMQRIEALCGCEVVVPDKQTLEYKEALIFAFLGTLYMNDECSCLSSVTGATSDNIGGMLFK